MQELRRHQRHHMPEDTVAFMGNCMARVTDLSPDGLSLLLPAGLQLSDTCLTLDIMDQHNVLQAVGLSGTVVWQQSALNTARHRQARKVGICFSCLKTRQKEQVDLLIRSIAPFPPLQSPFQSH